MNFKRFQPLAIAAVVATAVLATSSSADAATSSGTSLGTALNTVNSWKNDAQAWLPTLCILSWIGTGITLLVQGFQIGPALITFGGAALVTTLVLAGPALITGLAALVGLSGAVI